MIKNCNVSLDTTTVGKYVSPSPNNRKSKSKKTLNNSTSELSNQENSLTVSDTCVVKGSTSAKETLNEPHTRSRSKRNVPPSPVSSTFNKRKKDESPVIPSEQSRNSQRIVKNSTASKKASTKVENVQNKNVKEENVSEKLSTTGKRVTSPVVNGNRSLQQPASSVTRSKTQIPKESLRVTRRSEVKTSAKRR
ncbi:uncharacterized protein LOC129220504 [Uloborus diversus]|uniref:uncharacterized protein LOC129220504 n=1 Tax=Uloborus diversus TaxID=327109 RepID=UPI002409C312|nr:uncharacterized protein LOC129220504 [Uloborus diversus]